MKSGIYCIENLVNGKRYVGQGTNLEKRMWQHHRNCKALLGALSFYGEHNFSRFILEYCSIEKLNEREKYHIKNLHSHYTEHGYNLTWGGLAPMTGRKHTSESIEKMKLNRVNHVGDRHPRYGKKHKATSIEKMKLNHKDNSGDKNGMYDRRGELHPAFGRKLTKSSSKYYGVSKKRNGWQIYVYVNRKKINIGYNACEETSARIYDNYIISNNLPNPLNFKGECI